MNGLISVMDIAPPLEYDYLYERYYAIGESSNFIIDQAIIILFMFCYINIIFYKSKAEELISDKN